MVGEMDHPVSVESFSVAEAAEALGRSVSTLRRWIADDKIPAPYLRDVSKGNNVYSVGELQVISRYLTQLEAQYAYLVSDNSLVIEQLRQALHAYRAQFI